jgi:putative ABC transport system permease protein
MIRLLLSWLTRNAVRTALVVAVASVPAALVYLVYTYNQTLSIRPPDEELFWSRPRAVPLKSTQLHELKEVPGVVAAVGLTVVVAESKIAGRPHVLFGADPMEYFKVFSDLELTAATRERWRANPIGAIVESETARKNEWRVGTRISLKVLPGQLELLEGRPLELEIEGIVPTGSGFGGVAVHIAYLARLTNGPLWVASVYGRVARADQMQVVLDQIDTRFKDTASPTRSVSMNSYAKQTADDRRGLRLYLALTIAACFASMILIVAGPIYQSTVERSREFATLLALGFSRGRLVRLIAMETTVVIGMGAVLGVLVAWLASSIEGASTYVVQSQLQATQVASMVGIFCLCSIVAATILPAWKVATLDLAASLRS